MFETQTNSRKNYTFLCCEHYSEDGNVKGKGKGKDHPITGHEGPEEERYSSTLSLTTALDGSGLSAPRPGRSTPGNAPVHIA